MSIFFPRHDEPDPDALEALKWDEIDKSRAVLQRIRNMLVAPVSLTDAMGARAMLDDLIRRWEGVAQLHEASR